MTPPERFDLSRSSRRWILGTPWLLAGFGLYLVWLAWFPGGDKPGTPVVSIFLTLFGGLMLLLAVSHAMKQIPRVRDIPTSLDEDGLWPTRKGRETGLVGWEEIVTLHEQDGLLCVDREGVVRLHLNYQLEDFARLRAIVLERAKLLPGATPATLVFQATRWYHWSQFASLIGIGLLDGFFSLTQSETKLWLGHALAALLTMVLAWQYATTTYRLRIEANRLELAKPFWRTRVPLESVLRVELGDVGREAYRRPRVTLHRAGSQKPIHIEGLGAPALDLYRALDAWRRGGRRP